MSTWARYSAQKLFWKLAGGCMPAWRVLLGFNLHTAVLEAGREPPAHAGGPLPPLWRERASARSELAVVLDQVDVVQVDRVRVLVQRVGLLVADRVGVVQRHPVGVGLTLAVERLDDLVPLATDPAGRLDRARQLLGRADPVEQVFVGVLRVEHLASLGLSCLRELLYSSRGGGATLHPDFLGLDPGL